MKPLIFSAAALFLAASALPSAAQTWRTERREDNQQQRIWRGGLKGELTPREMRNLARQQQRIDRAQRRAAADGVITPRERRELERMQDRASRNIYRKKNNQRDLY